MAQESDGDWTGVPPRVEAAMQYIHWSGQVSGRCNESPVSHQELSEVEQKCHDAALQVLLGYFTGEMDYGDVAPRAADKGDEGPRERVSA